MLLPSYPPPPATTLPHLPRLLFVPVRGLAIVLRLGSLAVRPLSSGVVNMVDGHEDEEMTLLGEDDNGDPPGP